MVTAQDNSRLYELSIELGEFATDPSANSASIVFSTAPKPWWSNPPSICWSQFWSEQKRKGKPQENEEINKVKFVLDTLYLFNCHFYISIALGHTSLHLVTSEDILTC